jgi:hypothetical protein
VNGIEFFFELRPISRHHAGRFLSRSRVRVNAVDFKSRFALSRVVEAKSSMKRTRFCAQLLGHGPEPRPACQTGRFMDAVRQRHPRPHADGPVRCAGGFGRALLWLTADEASGFVTGVVIPINDSFAAVRGLARRDDDLILNMNDHGSVKVALNGAASKITGAQSRPTGHGGTLSCNACNR